MIRSNPVLLRKYGKLVRFVADKYVRSFRLTREQGEDLYHSLLAEMFKAKRGYRNYKGISLILKHKMRDIIAPAIKHEHVLPIMEIDSPRVAPTTVQLDVQEMLPHLDALPFSQRLVLELNFGLDGSDPFGVEQIARKLKRPTDWVTRRRAEALATLRSRLS